LDPPCPRGRVGSSTRAGKVPAPGTALRDATRGWTATPVAGAPGIHEGRDDGRRRNRTAMPAEWVLSRRRGRYGDRAGAGGDPSRTSGAAHRTLPGGRGRFRPDGVGTAPKTTRAVNWTWGLSTAGPLEGSRCWTCKGRPGKNGRRARPTSRTGPQLTRLWGFAETPSLGGGADPLEGLNFLEKDLYLGKDRVYDATGATSPGLGD